MPNKFRKVRTRYRRRFVVTYWQDRLTGLILTVTETPAK